MGSAGLTIDAPYTAPLGNRELRRYHRGMTGLRPLICACALTLLAPLSACSDGGDEGTILDEGGTSGDGDDDSPGDGDGDTTTTGDGDGDTTTTTGDGDGDTTTTTGDGDGDTTGDGDATGDGDGDTGDPPDTSTYSAVFSPGGAVDRITVTRINIDEPTCTEMILYSPIMFDDFDITMPDEWAIEEVRMWQWGFCPADSMDPDGLPDGGSGEITVGSYDALGVYPCTLNFDFEMDMGTDPPSTTIWNTQGVVVEGVNCG